MRTLCVGALCAVALSAAACGDDEPPTTTSSTSTTTGATGPTGPTGSTGRLGESGGSGGSGGASDVAGVESGSQLIECLEGEGLEAADAGTVLGLEDREVVEVAIGDLDGGAAIVIFESPEEAEEDPETTGTLAGIAYPEARGNVVFGFDGAADETPADEAAVDACLPAAKGGD